MLTRIYIDNYKCFKEFEYRPERLQLILGANGSGKTSFLEALLSLQQLVVQGRPAGEVFKWNERTRWESKLKQHFELDIRLKGVEYRYSLEVHWLKGATDSPKVCESLKVNGKLLFTFEAGQVTMSNGPRTPQVRYGVDPGRSALSTMPRDSGSPDITSALAWFGSFYCFRPNPTEAPTISRNETDYPSRDLHDFADWYRRLEHQGSTEELRQSLTKAIEGFKKLLLVPISQDSFTLNVEFSNGASYNFNELSDGQRSLVYLYTILHVIIEKGKTVILDEPENFLALSEIQPWLNHADMAAEDHGGQLLLISHSPKLIDQLASSSGVFFVRDGDGPVRVEKFRDSVDTESGLLASELVARGWVGANR